MDRASLERFKGEHLPNTDTLEKAADGEKVWNPYKILPVLPHWPN